MCPLGIVHRDVKPANILIAPDRAVLVDFGIAQAAESLADVTTASMLIGSPAYIAPERARGGTCGPPADLWGLGASLYAAVEGSGPFERGGGAMASLTAVIADGSANPEGEAQPDNAVPHGHIGKPAKPGKGKDKAGKPGKGNGKGG
jgi:serine/threonine protein kinase